MRASGFFRREWSAPLALLAAALALPLEQPTAPDVRDVEIAKIDGYAAVSATGIPERVRDRWETLRDRRLPTELRVRVPTWRLRYLLPVVPLPWAACQLGRGARELEAPRRIEIAHEIPKELRDA